MTHLSLGGQPPDVQVGLGVVWCGLVFQECVVSQELLAYVSLPKLSLFECGGDAQCWAHEFPLISNLWGGEASN